MHELVFRAVTQALESGDDAALVTIVATRGSTPQRVGAKMLVFPDGRTVGTIGGGCYEHDAVGKARDALRTRQPRIVSYDLTDTDAEANGLICGGRMDVFVEPLDPAPPLYLIGAGHVSQHVAHVAALAGFCVHVLDDRETFANSERFPDASHVAVAPIATWLQDIALPATAYVVVITRGHTHDQEALRAIAGRPLRYVGMIGSRVKVRTILGALADEGIDRDWLASVRAPIGLAIGAISPEEIAVSIVAELIAVRRGAPTGPAARPLSQPSADTGQ